MLVMEMSSKKQQIPAIRFNGFTDAWEQREFEDVIISIQTGTNLLGSESNHGTALIKMGNVQRGFFSFKKVEFLNENEQVEEKNMANFGDFLFNTRNTLELVGKGATWFGKNDEYAFNSNIARFTFEGINTTFFNYLYNTPQMIKQVQARAVGTTSVAAVYPKDLNSMKFWIPSANEQQKIGAFFKQLDDTIDLHQRQLDNYKELKKSMLQKVLPQEEEKVPEIRFDGFTGDWEQRKLGEIAEITSGGTPSTNVKEYWEGDIDWYSPVEIGKERYVFSSQRKITEFGLKKSSAKILPANKTILFTSRAGIGDMAILMKEGATNQGFQSLVLNERYDIYFVYSMGNKIKEFALKNAAGSTFLEISGKGLAKMELLIPTLEEQTIIGSFFKNIDDAIELHKRKVLDYQQLKKAMLQQMFV